MSIIKEVLEKSNASTIFIDFDKSDFPTVQDLTNIKLSRKQSEEFCAEMAEIYPAQYDWKNGLECEKNHKTICCNISIDWMRKNTSKLLDTLWILKEEFIKQGAKIESKNDIKRMIKQGGVRVNNVKILDEDYILSKIDLLLENKDGFVIKYGKLACVKLKF